MAKKTPDAVQQGGAEIAESEARKWAEMILDRVLPWCGTPMQAYVWFRSEPLPSFGDLTAEELVKRGMAEAVMEHIERIAEGGYA